MENTKEKVIWTDGITFVSSNNTIGVKLDTYTYKNYGKEGCYSVSLQNAVNELKSCLPHLKELKNLKTFNLKLNQLDHPVPKSNNELTTRIQAQITELTQLIEQIEGE